MVFSVTGNFHKAFLNFPFDGISFIFSPFLFFCLSKFSLKMEGKGQKGGKNVRGKENLKSL